jgi:hypothetical protein
VAPQPSQTSGTYTGTVTTSGSSFAGDNKTIAVTMNVTSQPIAQASPSHVNLTLAQGAQAETLGLALTNLGQGTLTVQSVSCTGQFLTANAVSGLSCSWQGFTATAVGRRDVDIRPWNTGAGQLPRIGDPYIQCGQWTKL